MFFSRSGRLPLKDVPKKTSLRPGNFHTCAKFSSTFVQGKETVGLLKRKRKDETKSIAFQFWLFFYSTLILFSFSFFSWNEERSRNRSPSNQLNLQQSIEKNCRIFVCKHCYILWFESVGKWNIIERKQIYLCLFNYTRLVIQPLDANVHTQATLLKAH